MTHLTEQRPAPPSRQPMGWSSPAPLRPRPDFGPTDTARGWIVTAVLTTLAALTRFVMLNHPTDGGTPVFDEKHYAPQAWQMLDNGWVEDNPGYGLIVHPPVGKQLIALGEVLFGYTGLGWRFSAALVGTILVLLVIRITRRLTRSTMLGAIAGILLICDGTTYVASRIGMLDIFLAVLITAAFGCLVVDRDRTREILARADAEGRARDSPYGPRLGVRWWRFGAGVLLGLGCGVKWSGLAFVVTFALLSLLFDQNARKTYGGVRTIRATAVRDLGPTVYALFFIPLIAYLTTYLPWFCSETAIYRFMPGNPAGGQTAIGKGGFWSHIFPAGMRSLWYWHARTLEFHAGLTNSAGNHHPWESKPWTWPMGLRPMLYYYADTNVTGCGQNECVKAVMLLGTPALWWVALPVLGWGIWRTAVRRDWRYGMVLAGYAAALLPWFVSLDRQMYYFYAVVLVPFLVMAVALVLGDILGQRASGANSERRQLSLLVVCLYVALVITNFIWIWPILTAQPITPSEWHSQLWLPSWR